MTHEPEMSDSLIYPDGRGGYVRSLVPALGLPAGRWRVRDADGRLCDVEPARRLGAFRFWRVVAEVDRIQEEILDARRRLEHARYGVELARDDDPEWSLAQAEIDLKAAEARLLNAECGLVRLTLFDRLEARRDV